MAIAVLTNAYVYINEVDLSDHVKSVTLPISCAEIDDTCMGATSVSRLPGLKDASLTITFAQDFDAAEVDATLWDVYDGGEAVTVGIMPVHPDTTAIAATNPYYNFSGVLTEYNPIGGSIGDLHEITATFICDGNVTRSTSA